MGVGEKINIFHFDDQFIKMNIGETLDVRPIFRDIDLIMTGIDLA